MRMIGQLQDEGQATRFGRFLYGRGIDNQVDQGHEGGWEIWVYNDARLDEAAAYLRQFEQNPDDPTFTREAVQAAAQRQREEVKEAPKRARVIDARTAFYRSTVVPYGIVTIALIALCVIVFAFTKGGGDIKTLRPLLVTEYRMGDRILLWQSLPEVFHGQIWRLFTPMFVHFGFIHIFFNMWWLWDLGNIIEARRGKLRLLMLVLVIAGVSNAAQYVVSGPLFGGMSGVVYGLLCYMWMQGKFNPASDLSLHPQIVTSMIVWFFLCLFGIIPGVANTAHGMGAAVGAAWGYIGARWALRHRR